MTKTSWQPNLPSPASRRARRPPDAVSVAVAALGAAIAPVPVEERRETQTQLAARAPGDVASSGFPPT
jgi:hypothetical protein